MKKAIKITKCTIDRKICESLFDFRGYTDDEFTALNRILDECITEKIPFTLSEYAMKIYKGIASYNNKIASL